MVPRSRLRAVASLRSGFGCEFFETSVRVAESGRLWQTAIDEQDAMPFDIIDRSAERARVVAGEAKVLVDARTFRLSSEALASGFGETLSPEAHERIGRFLSARGHDLWFGDMYEEECLRPGNRVSAAGCGRLEAGPPVEAAYRHLPSTMLVLRAAPEGQLVVASPEVARRERHGAYLGGKIAMIVGLAAIVAGVVVRLAGGQ